MVWKFFALSPFYPPGSSLLKLCLFPSLSFTTLAYNAEVEMPLQVVWSKSLTSIQFGAYETESSIIVYKIVFSFFLDYYIILLYICIIIIDL